MDKTEKRIQKLVSKFSEFTRKHYDASLNGDWNQALIPGHSGRHTDAYHQWIYKQLQRVDKLANGNTWKFLELFKERIITPVLKNPGLLYRK